VSEEKTTSLAITNINLQLPDAKPEYKSMLQNIQEKAPAIAQSSSNFYKSHSQFMGVTLDVTAITPVRSIKHTLAEIEQTKTALQEGYFRMKKTDIKVKKLERKLENETDDLERELLELKINELQAKAASGRGYVEAAVRKLNFFSNQYDNLMKKIGKEELSEQDYELEEVKYHIMTCMKQALTAARAHGGRIDEGNMIYVFDLGLPAAEAQAEVLAFLSWENEMMAKGTSPTHADTLKWLERCAEKWAHCPAEFANSRGFDIIDPTSLTNTPQISDQSEGV
jgi:hypothetical protein